MKKKKNILLVFVVILAILLFSLGIYFIVNNYKKQNNALYTKCYNLEKGFGGPIDIDMIDCIGNLRLEQSKLCGTNDQPKKCENIYVYDSLHHLNSIKNVDNYLIKDNNLYVIGDLNVIYSMNNNSGEYTYTAYLPMNDDYNIIEYKASELLPRYFIINSENGNMTLYKNFKDMPDEVKPIFQELEDGYNKRQ